MRLLTLTLTLAAALVPVAAVAQSAAAFSAAAQYSAQHDGDAVLVFRGDSLVLEEYQNGFAAGGAHWLASGTKTFACVLAALAQGDGLLTLDEPVARSIPEFTADSELARVTIRQLLNLTSGLGVDPASNKLARDAGPGVRFVYGGVGFVLFGEVLTRQLHGEDLLAYLGRRVFDPMGIAPSGWERDDTDRPGLASGAAFTARAWGQFGLLLLHRGRWRGRQLVPRDGLAQCGRGSESNPGYGLGVWLNAPDPTAPPPVGVVRAAPADHLIHAPDLPHDLWLAAGSGGQRLYILPSAGLVAVRFGHNTGPDYRDDAFLRLLLGK